MKNINVEVKGEKLILTIDLKQRLGLSKSQKTIAIASTEGNQKIGYKDVAFGLNVYTKEGLAEAVAKANGG